MILSNDRPRIDNGDKVSIVFKRGYKLQLPTRFIDIDRDEMEYLDGVISWIAAKIAVWSAIGYFIEKIVGYAIYRTGKIIYYCKI